MNFSNHWDYHLLILKSSFLKVRNCWNYHLFYLKSSILVVWSVVSCWPVYLSTKKSLLHLMIINSTNCPLKTENLLKQCLQKLLNIEHMWRKWATKTRMKWKPLKWIVKCFNILSFIFLLLIWPTLVKVTNHISCYTLSDRPEYYSLDYNVCYVFDHWKIFSHMILFSNLSFFRICKYIFDIQLENNFRFWCFSVIYSVMVPGFICIFIKKDNLLVTYNFYLDMWWEYFIIDVKAKLVQKLFKIKLEQNYLSLPFLHLISPLPPKKNNRKTKTNNMYTHKTKQKRTNKT
jgi:hypothetical protein